MNKALETHADEMRKLNLLKRAREHTDSHRARQDSAAIEREQKRWESELAQRIKEAEHLYFLQMMKRVNIDTPAGRAAIQVVIDWAKNYPSLEDKVEALEALVGG